METESKPWGSSERAKRVIIVEDEEPIRELVRFHLELGGFDCTTVSDGQVALRTLLAEPFDLAILDIALPGVDGLTLCRAVRRQGPNTDVPILVLTARQEESDKVLGFESGADDYLTKPFGVHEFMARAGALIRRRDAWGGGGARASRRVVQANGISIDPVRRRVFCDGREIHLTAQEFTFLYLLAANPDIVFTRAEIIEQVWQGDVFVDDRGVDTLVKRLRRKVEVDPSQPRRILTTRGTGYKFAPE